MHSSELKKLLVRYVTKSATFGDLEQLELWINDPNNLSTFKDYIKTQFAIQLSMNEPDSSKIRERLLKEIRNDKKVLRNRRVQKVFKYVAVAILFLSIGYFVKDDFFKTANNNPVIPKEEVITLQLENGDIKIISENGTSQIKNASGIIVGTQKGNQLVYKDKAEKGKLSYNTLKVPYGKRFDIILSDGTQVFLNSGSTLKYPSQFVDHGKRQVFLEGEAYFDVSHDEENPFSVISHELGVEVLGTTFNISNYEEDHDTEVVLVNGSVQLEALGGSSRDSSEVLLRPGFKGSFDKSKRQITTEEVNTSLYTSWVRGQIIFRNSTFENIVQKLERHYNVIIINNNLKLSKETFNATIDVNSEHIEQVLEYFNKIYEIDYEIVNNKIIIN